MVWAWVTVSGRPAHVRDMQSGINAIEAAYAIAAAFKDYEREMNDGERIHPAFRGLNHPVNVNLGTIEGGEWNSSVPTRARIGLRVGVMLGRTARETKADIERIVAEAARDERLRGAQVKLEFKGFMADPCAFDTEAEIVKLARRAHAEATGGTLRDYPATGLTDGRHFVLYQRHARRLLRPGRAGDPRHRRERRPRQHARHHPHHRADHGRVVRRGAGGAAMSGAAPTSRSPASGSGTA